MKAVVKKILVWRLWLVLVVVFTTVFLQVRENQVFTTLLLDHQLDGFLASEWVYPWSNFDGVHYLNIAQRGYIEEGRFLPLYPVLVWFFSQPFTWIFGNSISVYFWMSQLIQVVLVSVAVILFQKLVRKDYTKRITTHATTLLLSFPLAFFLVATYSESLFLVLGMLSLYLARQKKWRLAVLTGMLLAITRLSGVLLIFALLTELVVQNKGRIEIKKQSKQLLGFCLIPVLLLGYAYFNHLKWGDWLYFVSAHAQLGNSREVSSLVFPLVTVYRYLKILLTVSPNIYEFWIAVLEILALVYASVLMVAAHIKKLRPTYQVYMLSMITLPLLSGTLSGLPRYVLPLFPLFIVQAVVLEKRPKLFKLIVVAGLVLQAVLLALFARSYYVS